MVFCLKIFKKKIMIKFNKETQEWDGEFNFNGKTVTDPDNLTLIKLVEIRIPLEILQDNDETVLDQFLEKAKTDLKIYLNSL